MFPIIRSKNKVKLAPKLSLSNEPTNHPLLHASTQFIYWLAAYVYSLRSKNNLIYEQKIRFGLIIRIAEYMYSYTKRYRILVAK